MGISAKILVPLLVKDVAGLLLRSRSMCPFSFSAQKLFPAVLAGLAVTAHGAAPGFNRDVRPILSENCFLCHGQDAKEHGDGLRLDIRAEAIAERDGVVAIVPGDPEKSAMVRHITSTDPDELMPPPKAHLDALKPAQIEILKNWIKGGAEYEPHWSFVPPVKAEIPGGGKNPVDAFVRARLTEEGLKPSPPAPLEAQIRRLHIDLTGLPPTLAEIDSFLADTSPDRWEKRILSLMESPHFAERMAMPWLDAARYSDSAGFSIDDHRDMWGWRDWVINAFLKNQPYDKFVTEQLAGDLIPNATPDQIAATGFLRNSMNTHEGGTIEEEYRTAYTIDKVDAVATSMLGLTMKCCQCHDHKFDPISQKEYYQFFAFFNASSEPGKGATNSNTAPLMDYASPLGDGGMAGLKQRISELQFLVSHPSPEIVAARESWEAQGKKETPPTAGFPWDSFAAPAVKWVWDGQPADVQSVDLKRAFPVSGKVLEAWIFTTCDNSAELKLNGKDALKVVHWQKPGLVDVTGLLKEGENILEAAAHNDGGIGGFIAMLAWRTDAGWQTISSDETWQAKLAGAADWKPANVLGTLGMTPWEDVTSYVKTGAAAETGLPMALKITPAQRTPVQWKMINEAFIKAGGPLAKRTADMILTIGVEIGVLERDLKRGKTTVMVMDHKPDIRKTHILDRGSYDQPKEEVTAGTPAALPKMAGDGIPTRLDLAGWVTSPENPLTARVAVNRLWQMVFGRGIVETAGDFGNQGSWPSHPELLDWLAVDLVENGWDLRRTLMTILTSETYIQSAAATPENMEKDPRCELLSRSPRSRLPAEIIRDQALAVSGLLNPTLGGPGVHPPQPDLWSEISHFGYEHPFTAQVFLPGRGETTHRRSIYTFWKRTSPPPAIALFDAPTRETCTVVRGSTNTPLQALVTMNDPQYVEAALAFGHRIIAEGGTAPEQKLAYGFHLATGRKPTTEESKLLSKAFENHLARYTKDTVAAQLLVGEENPELAAYSMVASILLNLDELINRP